MGKQVQLPNPWCWWLSILKFRADREGQGDEVVAVETKQASDFISCAAQALYTHESPGLVTS